MLVLKFASSFDSPSTWGFDRLRARYLPFVRGEGGILGHALKRMTAPSAEGAKGDFASAEARRWTEPVWQLSDRPRRPFGSPLIDG